LLAPLLISHSRAPANSSKKKSNHILAETKLRSLVFGRIDNCRPIEWAIFFEGRPSGLDIAHFERVLESPKPNVNAF